MGIIIKSKNKSFKKINIAYVLVDVGCNKEKWEIGKGMSVSSESTDIISTERKLLTEEIYCQNFVSLRVKKRL